MAAKSKSNTKSKSDTKSKTKQAPSRRKARAKAKAPTRKANPKAKAPVRKASAGKSSRSQQGRAKSGAAAPPSRPLIQTLLAEHQHMANVMQLFSGQLDAIEAGEFLDPHLVYEIMDYMVTWPDRFHHPVSYTHLTLPTKIV